MIYLSPGDITAMTSCNVLYRTGADWLRLTYKSLPRRRMVFMYLGDEPLDGSTPLDVIERLNALGWSHPDLKPGQMDELATEIVL